MIIYDKYREPTGKKIYVPTGKDLEDWAWQSEGSLARQEEAYWRLAEKIEDELGPEGGTMADIYHKVTGPLGLSSSDTVTLVRTSKEKGYLK